MQNKNARFLISAGLILCAVITASVSAQAQSDSGKNAPVNLPPSITHRDSVALGVAVSPGVLRFSCKPGKTESHDVKVMNNTNMVYNFRTSFTDYVQNSRGKPLFNAGNAPKSKYALSKWATVSPSYFTLQPGKSQKLTITVTIPDNDTANIAAWTVMEVDQIKKKQAIPSANGSNSLSMGITPEIGFGVYIYQNPPNVKLNKIIIDRFRYRDTAYVVAKVSHPEKQLWLQVSNVGDGISFCVAYAELTNLKTGKTIELPKQDFTILPGYDREFFFEMPKDATPGDYSAVGVVYFGDNEPKKVAQLNFSYK